MKGLLFCFYLKQNNGSFELDCESDKFIFIPYLRMGSHMVIGQNHRQKFSFPLHYSLIIYILLTSICSSYMFVQVEQKNPGKQLKKNGRERGERRQSKLLMSIGKALEKRIHMDVNWPEGSCWAGEQPLDRGSRMKAKEPVKCWKLSAPEHLVKRLSQALAGSVQRKQTHPGKKQESWPGTGSSAGGRAQAGCVREVLLFWFQTLYSFLSFPNAVCIISYISNLNDSFILPDVLVLLCFIIKINAL